MIISGKKESDAISKMKYEYDGKKRFKTRGCMKHVNKLYKKFNSK